jgi:hypothetical protein
VNASPACVRGYDEDSLHDSVAAMQSLKLEDPARQDAITHVPILRRAGFFAQGDSAPNEDRSTHAYGADLIEIQPTSVG